MANEHPNLKNLRVPSSEVARIIGRKGGKKKAENVKKRKEEEKVVKTFKDLFLELAETQVTEVNDGTKGKIYEIVKVLFPNLPPDELTHRVILYASLYRTAIKGGKSSVQAFTAIRDTMGEKPVDEVHNTRQTIITISDKKKIQEVINKAKNA